MGASRKNPALHKQLAPLERRFAHRHALSLALNAEMRDERCEVLVHDVSRTGILLETRPAPAPGTSVKIDLPAGETACAEIVWQEGDLAGGDFRAPISRAQVSALRLRSKHSGAAQPIPTKVAWTLGTRPREEPAHDEKFSPPLRLAIILAAAALCWTPILVLGWLLLA